MRVIVSFRSLFLSRIFFASTVLSLVGCSTGKVVFHPVSADPSHSEHPPLVLGPLKCTPPIGTVSATWAGFIKELTFGLRVVVVNPLPSEIKAVIPAASVKYQIKDRDYELHPDSSLHKAATLAIPAGETRAFLIFFTTSPEKGRKVFEAPGTEEDSLVGERFTFSTRIDSLDARSECSGQFERRVHTSDLDIDHKGIQDYYDKRTQDVMRPVTPYYQMQQPHGPRPDVH